MLQRRSLEPAVEALPRLEGSIEVGLPADKVRELLERPETIADCIPGIQPGYSVKGQEFQAVVVAKIGYISGRFSVRGSISREGDDYRVQMEGSGAAGSSFRASGVIRVSGTSAGSRLAYSFDVALGGILAALGSIVIKGVVEGMVRDLFECVSRKMA
jgi:carbon monoxide dehydrogenase subunit G